MNSLANNKEYKVCKNESDPTLTDSEEVESFLHLAEDDPIFPSIFERFPAPSHVFDDGDCLSHYKDFSPNEFERKHDDDNSHYTFTTIQSVDNQELFFTDFENNKSTSPPLKEFSKEVEKCSLNMDAKNIIKSNHSFTLEEILECADGTCAPSQVFDDLGMLGSSSTDLYFNFLSSAGTEEKPAQPTVRATNSQLFSMVLPQKKKSVKFTQLKTPYKVQKTKQNSPTDYIRNIIQKYNMELNQILVPKDTTHATAAGQLNVQNFFGNHNPQNSAALEIDPSSSSHNMVIELPSRTSPGRPRKERRPTLLKKDANITLDEKLSYYRNILEEARVNNMPGIFLREQAVSELCFEDLGSAPSYLTLVLSNFDALTAYLVQESLERTESYRTLWKIKRSQEENKVTFEFSLSDEESSILPEDLEISIFTLIVPGHTIKHLVTSSQYLEMVNFMLGKHYNHAINDNLAEATVGSDGKMIPTQKHHASRVRSHVKKYLKRHVIKDMKRYTDDDRRDLAEFQYLIALHRIVMQSTTKKPFESKVSVALMELDNVKDALIKQAEFFIFKRLN